MRLIDADVLIAHIKDEIEECKPPYCGRANGKSIAYGTVLGLKSAIAFAEALATIEAEPVRHGEWVPAEGEGESPCDEWDCTACKQRRTFMYEMSEEDMSEYYPYCPNCGAKMKAGGQNE